MTSGQTVQHQAGMNASFERIAFSRKFILSGSPDPSSLGSLVPVYPNETIQSDEVPGLACFVHFVSPVKTRPTGPDPRDRKSHILSYLPGWSIKWVSAPMETSVSAGFFENRLVLFVRRKEEVVYCKIHHFITPEDVLFQIQCMFAECTLDQENDTIYLFGNLKEESQVYRLLMVYFKNLLISEMKFNSSPVETA